MSILGKHPRSGDGRCYSSCSHVLKCVLHCAADGAGGHIHSGKCSSCGSGRPPNDGACWGAKAVANDREAGLMEIQSPPSLHCDARSKVGQGNVPAAALGVGMQFVLSWLCWVFSLPQYSSASCTCSSIDGVWKSISIPLTLIKLLMWQILWTLRIP